MKIDYSYRLGDDLSPISGTFRDGTGNRVPIKDGVVRFHMRRRVSGTDKIDGAEAEVVDRDADNPAEAPTGDVVYRFSQADLDERGTYLGRFVALFSSGEQMSFPSYEPYDLVIVVW